VVGQHRRRPGHEVEQLGVGHPLVAPDQVDPVVPVTDIFEQLGGVLPARLVDEERNAVVAPDDVGAPSKVIHAGILSGRQVKNSHLDG
jgi:hypothetical protein